MTTMLNGVSHIALEYGNRLFISFSGGATSAYMTYFILNDPNLRAIFPDVKVVFANTGEESEKTLQFIRDCDKYFGFNTVWVEAVVHHNQRKGNSHKIVNFETASRTGQPFEEIIKKHGIPNAAFPHCTRELKLTPMISYMRSIGWKTGQYTTAIGIRADEPSRRSVKQIERKLFYPFMDYFPVTKPMVNEFWSKQPFRLDLLGFQGNCKWCWKKSMRKLFAVMQFDEQAFDFPDRMERIYGRVGPEMRKLNSDLPDDYTRTFFRKHLSTSDLRQMFEGGATQFDPLNDESLVLPDGSILDWDSNNDGGTGCVESCEVNFDQD